jgi:signal transduction histidine kinase
MLSGDPTKGLLFAKIGHSAVPFVQVSLLHYTFRILHIRRFGPVLLLFYFYATIMSLLALFTPLHFSKLIKHQWGLYPEGGMLMLIEFIICCTISISLIALVFYNYFRNRKSLQSDELNKLKYITASIAILPLCTMDYLPKLGFRTMPLGALFVITFVSLNAYAILKHRIFDIDIAIRKGVIYSLLATVITSIYLALIFLLENVFRGFVGYKSIPLTIFTITFFIIIFQPLKNKTQRFVDKYFFKASMDQLEQENVRLLHELQRSEKLKAVGTLAAGMAHEIKNPLTSIKVFTEYLPKKYQDKEFIDKFEKIVGSEVNKINDIVSQLLDFAKPRPLETRESNILKIMDETLDLLNSEFIKYHIKVIRDYDIVPPLKVDPVQIKQAFLNIILNAIEAMKKKSGILTISVGNRNADYVRISILDTGCGINKESLSHIFDPFFTKKESGTGLGLSIVHGIIEKHKGNIGVESTEGKETKFTILLPTCSFL